MLQLLTTNRCCRSRWQRTVVSALRSLGIARQGSLVSVGLGASKFGSECQKGHRRLIMRFECFNNEGGTVYLHRSSRIGGGGGSLAG